MPCACNGDAIANTKIVAALNPVTCLCMCDLLINQNCADRPMDGAVRPSMTIAAPVTGSPFRASSTRPPIDGPPWSASNPSHADNTSAAATRLLPYLLQL